MSGSGLTSDTDVAVPGRPAQRWSVSRSVRLPLPATAAVVYLGIRALGLVVVTFLLRQGAFQRAHLSLEQWIIGGDGAFYRSIAAHGYDHGLIQETHSAIFASFPGYPAAIDSLAWLPGVSIVSAGFAVTLLAGTVRSTALARVAAVAVAVVLALIQAARTRQRIGAWWRPMTALLLAPLGLLGYWGYVAWVTHRPDGWFWIEEHRFGISFDWGKSTIRVIPGAFLDQISVAELVIVLAILGAVALTAWSLTERIPAYLHVYTVVVAMMAFTISANWLSEKPRYFLPAILLALPVARLLAPLRTSILVPLIIVLTLASTWIGVYLLVIARLAS